MNLLHRAPSPVAETLRKARRFVDETTGVVRMLYEAPLSPGAPRIFGCGSLCRDESVLNDGARSAVSGSASVSRDQAIAGAIGEAIERYSAAFVPDDLVVHARYEDLQGRAIPPASLILYDTKQYGEPDFGYRPLETGRLIGWVNGHSLTRHADVLVPAFAVYQPYPASVLEPPVMQQVTTGLACGNTLEEAIYSALCEVVERDAAMLMWLQSRRAPQVDFATVGPGVLHTTLDRFGELKRHVTLLDVTTDLRIPAYVAMWDGPIYDASGAIFASCAKLDPQRAAAGALTELAQCLIWAASLLDRGVGFRDPRAEALREIEDHVMWPMLPASRAAIEFVRAGERRCNLPDAPTRCDDVLAAIEVCVDRIAARDLEVVVVDVTSPDVRECGLFVVRVIVPGAQPLFFGSGLHRISSRAHSSKYPDRASPSVNLHPHPFP